MPPCTRKRRQASNQAHRIAAAARPLQAIVHADRGGLIGPAASAVIPPQGPDLCGINPTHQRGTLRRPKQGPRAQQIPAQRVPRQVVMVQPVVGDQFMHQGQRQRAVGAGQQGHMLIAFFCGFTAPGVNANDLGTVAFGRLHMAPEMQVAGNRIAAPDDDQF